MKVLYFSFTKPSYLPSAALHTYLSGITGTFSAESRAGLQDTLQLRISSPSFFTYSSERKRQIPQQKVYYNNLYIQSAPCSSCFRRFATAMARSYHCSDLACFLAMVQPYPCKETKYMYTKRRLLLPKGNRLLLYSVCQEILSLLPPIPMQKRPIRQHQHLSTEKATTLSYLHRFSTHSFPMPSE